MPVYNHERSVFSLTTAQRLSAGLALLALSVSAAPQVPRPSPDFTIQIPPSGKASLSQYPGKTIVFAFIRFT
jgi:hypothetical protein